jgi:hypothetical protein
MSFTLQRFDFGQRDETNKDEKTTHETTVRKTNSSVQKSFRKILQRSAAKNKNDSLMEILPRHGMPRKRATKKTLKHNDADDANQSWAFHKGFGETW